MTNDCHFISHHAKMGQCFSNLPPPPPLPTRCSCPQTTDIGGIPPEFRVMLMNQFKGRTLVEVEDDSLLYVYFAETFGPYKYEYRFPGVTTSHILLAANMLRPASFDICCTRKVNDSFDLVYITGRMSVTVNDDNIIQSISFG